MKRAVSEIGEHDWENIASRVDGRDRNQCEERWGNTLNPRLVRGNWTPEEDRLIVAWVEQHGIRKWSALAKKMPQRGRHALRTRWVDYLDPNLKRDPWTPEEDALLLKAHKQYGNNLAKAAKLLPGRSVTSIRYRWIKLMNEKRLQMLLASPE